MAKRALPLLLLVLISAQLTPVGAQGDLEDELEDVRSQISAINDEIDATRQERVAVQRDLADAEERLAQLQLELGTARGRVDAVTADIAAAEDEMSRLGRQLETLAAELARTRSDIETTSERLQEQAVAMYMDRAAGYAGIVFSLRNVEEATVGLRYAGDVVASSEELLLTLQTLQNTEIRQQESIEANERAVEALIAELGVKREELVLEEAAVAVAAEAMRVEVAGIADLLAQVNRDIALFEDELAAHEADEARLEQAISVAAATGGTNPGILAWPLNGPVSSPFGYRIHPITGTRRLHAGIDISAGYGAPIRAAGNGVVILAEWFGGYGNAIVIDHGGGLTTLYAHQSALNVGVGAAVTAGDVIGYVGSTGFSTGPHLHFETREYGTPVNPMSYLNG